MDVSRSTAAATAGSIRLTSAFSPRMVLFLSLILSLCAYSAAARRSRLRFSSSETMRLKQICVLICCMCLFTASILSVSCLRFNPLMRSSTFANAAVSAFSANFFSAFRVSTSRLCRSFRSLSSSFNLEFSCSSFDFSMKSRLLSMSFRHTKSFCPAMTFSMHSLLSIQSCLRSSSFLLKRMTSSFSLSSASARPLKTSATSATRYSRFIDPELSSGSTSARMATSNA